MWWRENAFGSLRKKPRYFDWFCGIWWSRWPIIRYSVKLRWDLDVWILPPSLFYHNYSTYHWNLLRYIWSSSYTSTSPPQNIERNWFCFRITGSIPYFRAIITQNPLPIFIFQFLWTQYMWESLSSSLWTHNLTIGHLDWFKYAWCNHPHPRRLRMFKIKPPKLSSGILFS